MTYKVIFIDWYKTCSDSLYWGHWQKGSEKERELFAQIQKVIYEGKSGVFAQWMRGKFSSEETCSHIAREQSVSYEKIFVGLKESCEQMSWISPKILEQIARLRSQGVHCVIATDNADTFRRWTIPGMELEKIFDHFLISSEQGYVKYDKKDGRGVLFFDTYLKENNLHYRDVVLIDDHVDDGYFETVGFDIVQVTQKHSVVDILQGF